jgi:hypothetical protein
MGSNPVTVYWIDVSVASYYIKTNENMKITKRKVAKWGTPKKYLKKNDYDYVYSS